MITPCGPVRPGRRAAVRVAQASACRSSVARSASRSPLWPAVLFLLVASPAAAQERSLQQFIQQAGQLWGDGDVAGLTNLVHGRGPLLLDTGAGTETVSKRNAGAALRALFNERETRSLRPVRVTLAGGTPPRGFGELSWTFRQRGAPAAQTRTVYVGASLEDGAWRLTELRVMP
jgi:hypothetical protein